MTPNIPCGVGQFCFGDGAVNTAHTPPILLQYQYKPGGDHLIIRTPKEHCKPHGIFGVIGAVTSNIIVQRNIRWSIRDQTFR